MPCVILSKCCVCVLVTLPRDIRALLLVKKLERHMDYCEAHNLSVPDFFRSVAKKRPNKPAFIFNEQVWTFQMVKKTTTSNNTEQSVINLLFYFS